MVYESPDGATSIPLVAPHLTNYLAAYLTAADDLAYGTPRPAPRPAPRRAETPPAPLPILSAAGRKVRTLSATGLATADPAERRRQIAEAVLALPALGKPALGNRFSVHPLTAVWLATRPSPDTIAAYHRDLAQYLTWCAERPLDPFRAYQDDTDDYATALAQRYAPASIARKLATLSSWYSYLLTYDAASRNPLAGLQRPPLNRDHSTTTILSRAEAAAFLAAANADTRPRRLRTAALLGLLLTEGLRAAEICAADIAHLGHRRGHHTLTITGKDGQRRAYPLAPPIAAALKNYLADRATRTGTSREELTGPLFVTEPSGPHSGGKRLDRWAITKLIRRIAHDARIPTAATLSPQGLRQTFAALAMDAGAALHDVQHALGHADPRTTRAYDRTRPNIERHPALRILNHLTSPATDQRTTLAPDKPSPGTLTAGP
ncbi:tyrosine-type recombinase/integrase [Nonomuraea sp. 3-1Str]|uniref:tyrosine-type recombinase/integrase n=1 Tax=Nonomuraea sp. 3-1Str TaxID=2929801 RepID=UPI002857E13B|nr:tyrosine-type recombinase/integrase [Nonomuraea sp. 3-1Str]MDR8409482.1 tyrosine-type recombinase/integrase [Nonomuraea sp. 3-1Str]